MNSYCDNCNFKGENKQITGNVKVLCLHSDEWHRAYYSCGYWKLHDSTLSVYERRILVKDIRNKGREYEKYLQCVTNSGLVTLLGSVAIFFLIFVTMIGAFILPYILQ